MIPNTTLKICAIHSFIDIRSMLLALPVALAPGSEGLLNDFLVDQAAGETWHGIHQGRYPPLD